MSTEQPPPSLDELSALMPCPFCGGEAEISDHRYQGTMASGMETPEPYAGCRVDCVRMRPVRCDESPFGKSNGSLTYEQARARAIEAWNRRAPDSRAEEAEALRKALAELESAVTAMWNYCDDTLHGRAADGGLDFLRYGDFDKKVIAARDQARAALAAHRGAEGERQKHG